MRCESITGVEKRGKETESGGRRTQRLLRETESRGNRSEWEKEERLKGDERQSNVRLYTRDWWSTVVSNGLKSSRWKRKRRRQRESKQGYKQEEFLFFLFNLFKLYCFMNEPGKRLEIRGPLKGSVKSFWFKTFTHESFTEIWNLFYEKNKKVIIRRKREPDLQGRVG